VASELLRRQSCSVVVDKSVAVVGGTVDVPASSQHHHHDHHHQQQQQQQQHEGRRRTRTKQQRDTGMPRDARTDSDDDSSAAEAARPIRKLRRKKKKKAAPKRYRSGVVERAVEAPFVDGSASGDDDDDDDDAEAVSRDCRRGDVAAAGPEVDDAEADAEAAVERVSEAMDDYSASSPTPTSDSRSPVTSRRRQPAAETTATTATTAAASTSLYGQRHASAGFLADVHGSLPLLSRPPPPPPAVAAASGRGEVVGRGAPIKSASYQQFLTVDDAVTTAEAARRHRRRTMLSNYRPLAEQRRRHGLLSRLDVEFISSSQVFQMLSGERQRCCAYCSICTLPAVGGGH